MPELLEALVVEQTMLAADVRKLTLHMPLAAVCALPGQFLHLRPFNAYEPLLRRPFSIAEVDDDQGTVSIIYRIVGRGTECLDKLKPRDIVNCLGPLGQGFSLACERPLLVGGGMGLAPLVFLAQRLRRQPVDALLGGRNQQELFWLDIYQPLCDQLHVATNDGSVGQRGLTTDLLPRLLASGRYDQIFACGPRPMLAAVAAIAAQAGVACQVSLEEHMACGMGACLSCTCAGTDGKRRKICVDGPVFQAEEVFYVGT